MSKFEILTIFISAISLVIAVTSMVRTRKLEKLTEELSKKQIQKLDAEENLLSKANIDVELVGADS
ncbi:MAG: hypothetical protein GC138_01985, partial [Gammaproteobacteria bacterium]|nr:hypothetical protein [Gammaproteobacteria bacterium]